MIHVSVGDSCTNITFKITSNLELTACAMFPAGAVGDLADKFLMYVLNTYLCVPNNNQPRNFNELCTRLKRAVKAGFTVTITHKNGEDTEFPPFGEYTLRKELLVKQEDISAISVSITEREAHLSMALHISNEGEETVTVIYRDENQEEGIALFAKGESLSTLNSSIKQGFSLYLLNIFLPKVME